MSDVKPNAELAYKVLDHIDAHPDQWDQDVWWTDQHYAGCGSAGCFAGWAVVLSGGRIEFDGFNSIITGLAELDGAHVSDAAAQLLNADPYTADPDGGRDGCDLYLFSGGNDRTDLGRAVELIFGPRPGDAS